MSFAKVRRKWKLMILVGWLATIAGRNATMAGANQPRWSASEDSWNYWWTYSGFSGPTFWGLQNSDWLACDKGRRQSPIDVPTKSLVYDPQLEPLRVLDNNLISGFLYNDGHAIVFNASISGHQAQRNVSRRQADQDLFAAELFERGGQVVEAAAEQVAAGSLDQSAAEPAEQPAEQSPARLQFAGAGQPYPFTFEALYLRFGSDEQGGSEHQINSRQFAAELQLLAHNSHLYGSFAEAAGKPHGLLAISILLELQQTSNQTANQQLERLLELAAKLGRRGDWTFVPELNLTALLPETSFYVTYEGSLTFPGCHESVNWLLLNRPLYVTQAQLNSLRSLAADEHSSGTLVAGNIRPVQAVNNRPIRTNIRPTSSNSDVSSIAKQVSPSAQTKVNNQHHPPKNPAACQRLWTRYDYRLPPREQPQMLSST